MTFLFGMFNFCFFHAPFDLFSFGDALNSAQSEKGQPFALLFCRMLL